MSNYQNVTPIQLSQAALTTSYTTLYTAPTNPTTPTRTYLKDMDICNTTAGSLTVYVHIVLATFSAGTQNAILYNTTVPAYSTLQWSGTQILPTLASIQAKASGTGLTITISGGEAV